MNLCKIKCYTLCGNGSSDLSLWTRSLFSKYYFSLRETSHILKFGLTEKFQLIFFRLYVHWLFSCGMHNSHWLSFSIYKFLGLCGMNKLCVCVCVVQQSTRAVFLCCFSHFFWYGVVWFSFYFLLLDIDWLNWTTRLKILSSWVLR